MVLIEMLLIILFLATLDCLVGLNADYIDGEINKEFSINKIQEDI